MVAIPVSSQVKDVSSDLNKPRFDEATTSDQASKNLWCCACTEEVPLHLCTVDRLVTLNYSAFLHFSRYQSVFPIIEG